MAIIRTCLIVVTVVCLACAPLHAQVYSPKVLLPGQADTTDLESLARRIFAQAHAATPRQKAESIWRFFLTDGRFVKPGFWYHIAGWAYEEPQGEVLDPLKLLNSYGFGLCYQIAPLLEAVFEACGFEDARVWFLTGHTVAEVYYDGAYHHFDSDMMGYSTVGSGSPKSLPVASVSQIARDGHIILGKLKSPTRVDETKVDYPWYPADVREAAIGGLAALFTSTSDNRLSFPIRALLRDTAWISFCGRANGSSDITLQNRRVCFTCPSNLTAVSGRSSHGKSPRMAFAPKTDPGARRTAADGRPAAWNTSRFCGTKLLTIRSSCGASTATCSFLMDLNSGAIVSDRSKV